MSANPNPLRIISARTRGQGSRDVLAGQASNEFVFAVVGHAGSGTSVVGETLRTLLESTLVNGVYFDVSILKARTVIEEWARNQNKPVPAVGAQRTLGDVKWYQDSGDEMRAEETEGGTSDYAAVAQAMIELVPRTRAAKVGVPYKKGGLNGSMQHSAQTHIHLKTKAKSASED